MSEPAKPPAAPRVDDIVAKHGRYGGADAMRTAMLRWLVDRWGPCCRGGCSHDPERDSTCDQMNEDDPCPACVARKELRR